MGTRHPALPHAAASSSGCIASWRIPRSPDTGMKIIMLDDDSIRLEPTGGALTIEALSPDQSYSPFHMLGSSLATCTFSVLYSWAAHAKLDATGLVLEVRWGFADDPHRVADVRMTIDWPGLPEARRKAATRVAEIDRKSTRLNSSHVKISYAV